MFNSFSNMLAEGSREDGRRSGIHGIKTISVVPDMKGLKMLVMELTRLVAFFEQFDAVEKLKIDNPKIQASR